MPRIQHTPSTQQLENVVGEFLTIADSVNAVSNALQDNPRVSELLNDSISRQLGHLPEYPEDVPAPATDAEVLLITTLAQLGKIQRQMSVFVGHLEAIEDDIRDDIKAAGQ